MRETVHNGTMPEKHFNECERTKNAIKLNIYLVLNLEVFEKPKALSGSESECLLNKI